MKDKIIVLGKVYNIMPKSDDEIGGVLGMAFRDKQNIWINQEAGVDQQAETLLHEIIHIISDELILELKEETVARLAVGIYSAGWRVQK